MKKIFAVIIFTVSLVTIFAIFSTSQSVHNAHAARRTPTPAPTVARGITAVLVLYQFGDETPSATIQKVTSNISGEQPIPTVERLSAGHYYVNLNLPPVAGNDADLIPLSPQFALMNNARNTFYTTVSVTNGKLDVYVRNAAGIYADFGSPNGSPLYVSFTVQPRFR